MGKAAAALTTLRLLLPWMCTSQKPHEFPTCPSAARLPPGHGLPSSSWIVLAPAVVGDRSQACLGPGQAGERKGPQRWGTLEAAETHFLSSRTFPEAAVAAGVLWGEHGVLSDVFCRDGAKAEGSSHVNKQGRGLGGSSPPPGAIARVKG